MRDFLGALRSVPVLLQTHKWKSSSGGGVLGRHLWIFYNFFPLDCLFWGLWQQRFIILQSVTLKVELQKRFDWNIWGIFNTHISSAAQLGFLIFSKLPPFSPITDVALKSEESPDVHLCWDLQRTSSWISQYIFVNCVFLVFLFVLQLGLLCLVQRSKPCQHITLFIRQRCYQISLRLEETLLSNNYWIYIYVLPLRETLKCCVSVRAELGLSVHCWIETGSVRGGIREWIPLWCPTAGGCEESLGGNYNCLNWNFSKTEEVVKSSGLIHDHCGQGFIFYLKELLTAAQFLVQSKLGL